MPALRPEAVVLCLRALDEPRKVGAVRSPWLSVVMPVHNGENYLARALESVRIQQEEGIELIIVEGGSTDETIKIIKSFEGRLPLTRFHRDDLGNWVSKSNFGLSVARGEYVCFLHHDDLWLSGRLEVLTNLVRAHPDTTLFLHPSWYVDATDRRVGLWRCPLPSGRALGPESVLPRLLVQNSISMPAPLFSREVALRVGGLDEALWYTADWDFWLKLAAAGTTWYHPRPLSAFRIHPQAQTMRGSHRIEDFRAQLETVLDRHMGGAGTTCRVFRRSLAAARFSVEMNTGLAALVHGHRPAFDRLAWDFLRLGPRGCIRYLRDSRIFERSLARYRIGLASRS